MNAQSLEQIHARRATVQVARQLLLSSVLPHRTVCQNDDSVQLFAIACIDSSVPILIIKQRLCPEQRQMIAVSD
jgi:hypothetical protein